MQFSKVLTVLALGFSVNALPTGVLPGGSEIAARGDNVLAARSPAGSYECPKCYGKGKQCRCMTDDLSRGYCSFFRKA
ncbi:uncharacterized protein PpBr36_09851 [Pyricularia pennisetigena]|uniref:uncharacterized protein n=1 Tax=Pyricularia pennisetigena TaxID=1578925 RepID=UPI00114DD2B4|nr:uncharacterized protein PpBr36_09851 [Pyricularia pennisetigena]TLS22276.1 hypothetical protein PpBr36_09851 [Pyricularia pennisetigena]